VPLNGRNFEYFSEDPYITGKFAAAMIRGVEKYGNSATVKHFAANSQEFHRRDNDAVMSERAAREIYLKGFEYAIKEGNPRSLMTSYNLINGIWSANNYELNTTVLRGEWGYRGFVVTDWWPRLSFEQTDSMPLCRMVEAQNDVYMPTANAKTFNHDLNAGLTDGKITLGQLQRNAMNILRYLADSHALERFESTRREAVESLIDKADQLTAVFELTAPEPDREYKVELESVGAGLLYLEYSSSAPDISQMTVNISVDGVNAVSLTVNGTGGEKKAALREIATVKERFTVSFKYPADLLTVERVEIRK
jgi:beta-glucosidase